MDKMMRSKKKFGRCQVEGHGCNCEVSKDIQSTPITRAEEKKQWLDEAKQEMDCEEERYDKFQDILNEKITKSG